LYVMFYSYSFKPTFVYIVICQPLSVLFQRYDLIFDNNEFQ